MEIGPSRRDEGGLSQEEENPRRGHRAMYVDEGRERSRSEDASQVVCRCEPDEDGDGSGDRHPGEEPAVIAPPTCGR